MDTALDDLLQLSESHTVSNHARNVVVGVGERAVQRGLGPDSGTLSDLSVSYRSTDPDTSSKRYSLQ